MNSLQRVLRNTVALSFTGGVRVAFGLVIQVLIARALGPEGLGKFAIMTAYIAIFQVIARFGLDNLLVREVSRHRTETARYWWSSLIVFFVTSWGAWGLLAIVATVWGHPPDTYRMVLIAGASLIPFAFVICAESVLRGLERMEIIPVVQMIAYTIYLASTVLVLVMRWSVVALGWTQVAMHTGGALLYVAYLLRRGALGPVRLDLGLSRRLVRQTPHFFVLALASVFPTRFGVVVIGKMLGEEASGILNAAQLFLRALRFVSIGYAEALYPAFSRLFTFKRENFVAGARAGIRYGIAFSVGMSLMLVGWAPLLVGIFKNPAYLAAVPVLYILSWRLVFATLNGILNSVQMAANRQDLSMYIALVKVVAFLIAVPVLTALFDLAGAALGMLAAPLVGFVLNVWAVHRIARVLPRAGIWLRVVAGVGISLVVLLLTRGMPTVVGGSLSLLVYVVSLVALGVLTREDASMLAQFFNRSAPKVQEGAPG